MPTVNKYFKRWDGVLTMNMTSLFILESAFLVVNKPDYCPKTKYSNTQLPMAQDRLPKFMFSSPVQLEAKICQSIYHQEFKIICLKQDITTSIKKEFKNLPVEKASFCYTRFLKIYGDSLSMLIWWCF